ncbi:MAG: twin-arginine translocase TatA/TatE family subunit [Candidatus Omnitrophica bacterium]|nr:twin-arginine translocase TatA/TatE family subunit [Candidatus Omnitrophota bacterium]
MRFGPLEILLIVLLVVLLFGGSRIKDLMRGAGEGIREFKKGLKEDTDKVSEENKTQRQN